MTNTDPMLDEDFRSNRPFQVAEDTESEVLYNPFNEPETIAEIPILENNEPSEVESASEPESTTLPETPAEIVAEINEPLIEVTEPPVEAEVEPESYRTEDGSLCEISKVNKGHGRKYQAKIQPVEGNAQYFYSDTKVGLLAELVKAQANASSAIRRLNKQLKEVPQVKKGRELNIEERASANLLFQTDPVAAQEFVKEIETGESRESRKAAEQEAERQRLLANYQEAALGFTRARNFLPNDENRFQMVNWLSRKYLGVGIDRSKESVDGTEDELLYKGYITATNLCNAFDVLDSNGLLEKPVPEQKTAVLQQPTARIETAEIPAVPALPVTPKPVPQVKVKPRVTGIRPSESIEPVAVVPNPDEVLQYRLRLAMSDDPKERELSLRLQNQDLERLARERTAG